MESDKADVKLGLKALDGTEQKWGYAVDGFFRIYTKTLHLE